MKKNKFIELGLISVALLYGVGSLYNNDLNKKIENDYNPQQISEQLSSIDKNANELLKKLEIGISEGSYLKEVDKRNINKDLATFSEINQSLHEIKLKNKDWNKYKEMVENQSNWTVLDKTRWVYRIDNLKNNYNDFMIVQQKYKKIEPKINEYQKESEIFTTNFIEKNKDLNIIEDVLNKSHKELNILNDKSLSVDKTISFLQSNQNIINTFKIKDTQEKDFNANQYVAKMSVVTNNITHLLKKEDEIYKSLENIKKLNLSNKKEQKDWVLGVKEVNRKLENKEIKEKIKNDLTSVEKEVIPVLEKVKELEKELKEIVKTKVQSKDFDLNKIAQIHKEKIKNEIKDDLKLAQENSDNEVVNDLNELNNIANNKIDEDKNILNELVTNLEKENTTQKTQENNNAGGMNLFHYYLMYSWLNSSTSSSPSPVSSVTNNLSNSVSNSNRFTNNINPSNIGSNMYTVKTADGGYSTDGIIGSKLNNNLKTKSTNSYRSISVRKISVGRTSSMSMGG